MCGNQAKKNVESCTTVLVGKSATVDGSVMMATSCDGNIMGRVFNLPAQEYGKDGTQMFFDFPAPVTWEEYEDQVEEGDTFVGHLPVEQTYRCVLAAGHFADSITGGINEYGLSLGIEYMGMKPELVNPNGIVSSCSSHWTTSLIANGLMRAKTAREAIGLMGAMVEKYGFTYYWAPTAGCAIPVVDGQEAWIMEIFGPGEDWTQTCGEPGGVWCAQRVPDGEVTCNTNRSRIGEIDPNDADHFMLSTNVYTLAEKLRLWQPGRPLVWYDVYGTVGDKTNSLREWGVLNALAPSLGLVATGDAEKDRYPFSVKPDEGVSVQTLTSVMRDYYEGTPFDVTEHPAFCRNDVKSPLARPFGSRDLFDLLGVEPERCVGTNMSGYVYISQIRDWLPDPIAGCMWFTLGPSYTSCFVPIYAGVTKLVDSWSNIPNFAQMDRAQVQWKFQLVESLTGLKYQEAIVDVREVYEMFEEQFLGMQAEFEAKVIGICEQENKKRAEMFVTEYTNACLERVDRAYGELVDYLMFRYLYNHADVALPERIKVGALEIPDLSKRG